MSNPRMAPYAHHLVSSLYAMKGLIESYLLNREESLFENQEEVLKKSEQVLRRTYTQAEQALEIAKRLKEIGREERSVLSPSLLQEAWPIVLDLVKQEGFPPGIDILERIPGNLPSLACDGEDLKEILYHLTKNALEALGGQGKLVLRGELSFSTGEEPFVSIQIADTGPGIPPALLPRLFHPFFTTKALEEGNGLGLYLVRELVRKNKGRITVSSFPGFGTSFFLALPLLSS